MRKVGLKLATTLRSAWASWFGRTLAIGRRSQGETGLCREHIEYKPTKIGSRVFIAGPSVVLAGVTIGDGAIYSAVKSC